MAQLVKNPPAMWQTSVQSLGWEDPLEKGKATHSSIPGLENSMDYGVTKSWARLSDSLSLPIRLLLQVFVWPVPSLLSPLTSSVASLERLSLKF